MHVLVTEETKLRTHFGNEISNEFRIVSNDQQQLDFVEHPLYTEMIIQTSNGSRSSRHFGTLEVKTQQNALLKTFKPKYHNAVATTSLKFDDPLPFGNIAFQSEADVHYLLVTNELGQVYKYLIADHPRNWTFLFKSENGFLQGIPGSDEVDYSVRTRVNLVYGDYLSFGISPGEPIDEHSFHEEIRELGRKGHKVIPEGFMTPFSYVTDKRPGRYVSDSTGSTRHTHVDEIRGRFYQCFD